MTITRNTRAHPRACGENYKNLTLVELEEGSSPRVRGKRPGVGDPAPGGAHPRVCGENRSAPLDNAPSTGSSPRVRGKPIGSTGQRSLDGLIPACAGKTRCCVRGVGVPPAHPRACGENMGRMVYQLAAAGSSPRVRGKPDPPRQQRGRVRLIPARAGKTTAGIRPGSRSTAHPRACGENSAWCGAFQVWGGSSPRVRGKRPSLRQPRHSARLIPARAGKT